MSGSSFDSSTRQPDHSVPPLLASNKLRDLLVVVLSSCLGLYLADAAISLLDDSLIVFFNFHILSSLRALVGIFSMFMALGLYGLIGLTPMVPKRLFLVIPLSNLAVMLAAFPLAVYFFGQTPRISFCLSIVQVMIALGILCGCLGGFKIRWPLVPVDKLNVRVFSWWNLSIFIVTSIGLIAAIVIYYFLWTAQMVSHFTEGFMTLHPAGITVQVRKYVRSDGKMIELFPMSHVADANFYWNVARTFPTNSIILVEGVTDSDNLLTNRISYKRMAATLGLSEQKKEFTPASGEVVRADIDVNQFSSDTIACLNVITLLHSKGVTWNTFQQLMQFSPSDRLQEELIEDLLRKRNRHVVEEIKSHLSQTDNIMVPWGVAHMAGIADEIQKAGFQLDSTQDYMVIRFHG